MSNFGYNNFKGELLKGNIDLDAGGDDIRVILCMSNTDADTLKTADTVSAFTLDEMDGANYVRKALANEAVVVDDANFRGEFDADDVTWSDLGAGTRNVVGAVVYKHVTNDADSIPLAWIDDGGFPFSVTGADVTVQWNAEGIIQAT